MPRCPWAKGDAYERYHDTEWGVPVHDDRVLFEFLILEGAQAGLSWSTILAKRENYRRVFDGFDPARIARYGPAKVRALLADPGIVRNRLKVSATISNAAAYLDLRKQGLTLADLLWTIADPTGDRRPRVNRFRSLAQVPAQTPVSQAMSKELARRGFRFIGPTIMYAFMQATGMVNDHLLSCPRHAELAR
jgi:DNA-3-methyladenine glycosylase I